MLGKRLFSGRCLFAAFVLSVMGYPFPAHADLTFCNHTRDSVEAAFGFRDGDVWVSQGWWRLEPNKCARVFSEPVLQRFYFYYAHAVPEPGKEDEPIKVWKGKNIFCVSEKAFKIVGDNDCETRQYAALGFERVDVGVGQRNYTLTFEP